MKIGLLFLVTLHCVNAQQNQWKVSVTNPTITSITELPNGNRRVCGTFALTNTGADLRSDGQTSDITAYRKLRDDGIPVMTFKSTKGDGRTLEGSGQLFDRGFDDILPEVPQG
eukprot:gene19298-286_t